MLTDQARNYIVGLSNEELAKYLRAAPETYEPEAVAFARAEFDRRGLDPAVASRLDAEAAVLTSAEEIERASAAQRPLDGWGKTNAFLAGCFGLPIIPLLLVQMRFRRRGEDLKIRQMWKLAFIGFGTMWLIGLAAIIIVVLWR